MTVKLKMNLSNKESAFFSEVTRLYHGLENLTLYHNRPERVVSLEQIKAALDTYGITFEASRNYDRGEIAKRKMARKVLTELLKKARDYIQSIATEEDIPALIAAGFEVVHYVGRKKSTVAPT